MKVAILGCGPAGLLACHAAKQVDADVDVFSVKHASPMGGAQYLHEQIPGITEKHPDGVISYMKIGSASGYADKVYGSPLAPTSWSEFQTGDHPCWSLPAAYRELQSLYWHLVKHEVVKGMDVDVYCDNYDLVFSTIPADKICLDPMHVFKSQQVVLAPTSPLDVDNVILYNGRPIDRWYRTSSIFGHKWTEWSIEMAPAKSRWPDDWAVGKKPIDTECDCHLEHDNFHRLGRFGQWKKAVLTSDAYERARKAVNAAVARV